MRDSLSVLVNGIFRESAMESFARRFGGLAYGGEADEFLLRASVFGEEASLFSGPAVDRERVFLFTGVVDGSYRLDCDRLFLLLRLVARASELLGESRKDFVRKLGVSFDDYADFFMAGRKWVLSQAVGNALAVSEYASDLSDGVPVEQANLKLASKWNRLL